VLGCEHLPGREPRLAQTSGDTTRGQGHDLRVGEHRVGEQLELVDCCAARLGLRERLQQIGPTEHALVARQHLPRDLGGARHRSVAGLEHLPEAVCGEPVLAGSGTPLLSQEVDAEARLRPPCLERRYLRRSRRAAAVCGHVLEDLRAAL